MPSTRPDPTPRPMLVAATAMPRQGTFGGSRRGRCGRLSIRSSIDRRRGPRGRTVGCRTYPCATSPAARGCEPRPRRPLPLEPMRRRLPLFVLLLALVAPVSAQAATFPGDPIDGPAAGLRVADLDLARDGTGAVAYVRPEGVFVSRFIGGKFQAPEGLGPGGAGAGAAVAAGSNGRLAVVFSSGGLIYASLKVAGDQPWGAPVLLGAGTDPAADMSINNVAYATFTQAGNVVVARLDR